MQQTQTPPDGASTANGTNTYFCFVQICSLSGSDSSPCFLFRILYLCCVSVTVTTAFPVLLVPSASTVTFLVTHSLPRLVYVATPLPPCLLKKREVTFFLDEYDWFCVGYDRKLTPAPWFVPRFPVRAARAAAADASRTALQNSFRFSENGICTPQ